MKNAFRKNPYLRYSAGAYLKKNSQIHIYIETVFFEDLKREAQEECLSMAELCRRKLRSPISPHLVRIEEMVSKIYRKII